MTHVAIQHRRLERQRRVRLAAQLQPHLPQAEQVEVVDEERRDQHQQPAEREARVEQRLRRRAISTFHTTPPIGSQNANNAIRARLESSVYVLRSASLGMMRVHQRLNAGRAITLC